MDNNPNNPMTWYDLVKILEEQPLWLLKKPIRLFETYEKDNCSGCANHYPHAFVYPADSEERLLWKENGGELALEFNRKNKKPKERYTIRINRVMDAEVFAESKEQAEEIGHKIANEDIPDYAIDSLLEIMGSCNFEFVKVHDEVLDVADGFFTEEECEEILKG